MRNTEKTRIVTLTAKGLMEEGRDERGQYGSGKWGGLYLRAPDIYFRILEKAGDKLVRLGDVAEVRFGIKTGANDFFYLEVLPYRPVCPLCGKVHGEALTKEEESTYWERGERPPANALVAVKNGAGWEGYLEATSLAPVIRSPRDLPDAPLEVRARDLDTRVFYPLILDVHAQHYVSWGERAEVTLSQGRDKGKRIKGYHNLPSVGANQPWWRLSNPVPPPNLVCMMSYNDRFGFWINWEALVDARLYTIRPNPGVELKALAVALNWSFVFLQQGLLGRSNLGQGALDFKVYEARRLWILDPLKIEEVEGRFAELSAFRVSGEGEKDWVAELVLGHEWGEELHRAAKEIHLYRLNRAANL